MRSSNTIDCRVHEGTACLSPVRAAGPALCSAFLMFALMLAAVLLCPAYAHGADALSDGVYTVGVTLEGGSGRASVESPAQVTVEDGAMTATIVWSSSNYDLMIVDEQRYTPISVENGSTFEIPVASLDTALDVQAETTAMSTPHLIDYQLIFDASSVQSQGGGLSSAQIVLVAVCAIVVVAIIVAGVMKKRKGRERA